MKRIVSEVSYRRKREEVNIVGYSKSDRGSRFVNGVIGIETGEKSPAEINVEIGQAIAKLLKNQAAVGSFRMDEPGIGG